MITRATGAAIYGIDPYLVTVEADMQRGIPKFEVVGLASSAIQEGRNRVLSALKNSGIALGSKRVTVNLAPASIRKEGAALDLPIALSLVASLGIIPPEFLQKAVAVGELSLDGSLRPVRGALAISDFAVQNGFTTLIVPRSTGDLFPTTEGLTTLAPSTLTELIGHIRGEGAIAPPVSNAALVDRADQLDWKDVGGQYLAKRALEIAAAGHHNVLLGGPPGVGKTLLARRLPSILPSLEGASLREVQRIYSILDHAGGHRSSLPPFRAPHHNVSAAGITGGGKPFRPGEMTLAHRGVLFMDELAECRRDVIEVLREPLEAGTITVSRSEGVFALPARFLFIGAMNLCPCGGLGDTRKTCICPPPALMRYRNKVSSPIRDRIDLHVTLSRPDWLELWNTGGRESSANVRGRVDQARKTQTSRNGSSARWNASVTSRALREIASPDPDGERILSQAVEKLGLSARGIEKALCVARTIADIEGSAQVRSPHIAEALQYRHQNGFAT